MAKSGRKTEATKQVGFRMPIKVYEDYSRVAESRGVDLSALLNWVAVEYRPFLLLKFAETEVGLLRADVVGFPRHLGAPAEAQEALTRLNVLIGSLQDVASKLSAQIGGAAKPAA